MATNFNKNAISSSGGFKPMSTNTPLDIRTVVETENDILSIPRPFVGMVIYVKDTGKRFEVLTLKDLKSGISTILNGAVDEYREIKSSNYDDSELKTLINNKADRSEIPSVEGLATKDFVTQQINQIELIPGPQGPKGEQGIPGPQGVFNPNTTFNELLTNSKTIIEAINELYRLLQNIEPPEESEPEEPTDPEPPSIYNIKRNLTNITSSNIENSINAGSSFSTQLTCPDGYEISSVKVTMGGVDITNSVYSPGDDITEPEEPENPGGNSGGENSGIGNIVISPETVNITTNGGSSVVKAVLSSELEGNSITWKSSDSNMISITPYLTSSAIIRAFGEGTYTVTATCNGVSGTCTVIANFGNKE